MVCAVPGDSDSRGMPPHGESRAAVHFASVLRLAKAALLFSIAGAVLLPFFLKVRTKWWGIECGPMTTTDADFEKRLDGLESLSRRALDAEEWADVVFGIGNRIERLSDRL